MPLVDQHLRDIFVERKVDLHPCADRTLRHCRHSPDKFVYSRKLRLQHLPTAKGQQPAAKFGTAPGRIQCVGYQFDRLRIFLHTIGKKLQIAGNYGQNVVEIVCDTAGQVAECFHSLHLAELAFQFPALGDIDDVTLKYAGLTVAIVECAASLPNRLYRASCSDNAVLQLKLTLLCKSREYFSLHNLAIVRMNHFRIGNCLAIHKLFRGVASQLQAAFADIIHRPIGIVFAVVNHSWQCTEQIVKRLLAISNVPRNRKDQLVTDIRRRNP